MVNSMSFSDDNVLITGGLGFIGSHLARYLVNEGAHVTLVDSLIPEYGGNLYNIKDIKNKVTVNISDVRDAHSMRHLIQDQDYLFNLAGQTSHLDSMTDPFTDLEINCHAQLSILEACRKYNSDIKIVFAGTRQVYGKPDYLPVDEKHPIRPVDINGIHKVSGEWYHLLYNNVYGIRSTALRLTNTYGPGMRVKDSRQTFLGIWVRLLLEGKPIQIFGEGTQLRDFNFVSDVVNALQLAARKSEADGRVFNLGDREKISLKELAALLVRINGEGDYQCIPFPPDRKAIDIGDYYSDHTLIEKVLNWKPAISLEEGLCLTLDYYKKNLQHYI